MAAVEGVAALMGVAALLPPMSRTPSLLPAADEAAAAMRTGPEGKDKKRGKGKPVVEMGHSKRSTSRLLHTVLWSVWCVWREGQVNLRMWLASTPRRRRGWGGQREWLDGDKSRHPYLRRKKWRCWCNGNAGMQAPVVCVVCVWSVAGLGLEGRFDCRDCFAAQVAAAER